MILPAILYLLLPGVQIIFFLINHPGIEPIEVLNIINSILLTHWIYGNIILSAKIPLLQSIYPYDKRIKTHINISFAIIVSVLLHVIYKIASQYGLDFIMWSLIITILALFVFSFIWMPSKIIFKKNRSKKKRNYDFFKSIHKILLMVIVLLITVHIWRSGLLFDSSVFSFIFYILLFLTAVVVLIISRSKLFTFQAEIKNVKMTGDLICLSVKPSKKLSYKSGQFIFLGGQLENSKYEEHPFSFLSCPSETLSDPDQTVSFTIKKLGDFTEKLLSINEGTKVRLRGPFGSFYPKGKKSACLIGSGIGIVPIISILKDMHNRKDNRKVQAFLSVHDMSEIPGYDQLTDITNEMPNIEIKFLVSNQEKILFSEDYFRNKISSFTETDFLICSSENVLSTVIKALKALGVKNKQISFENFTF